MTKVLHGSAAKEMLTFLLEEDKDCQCNFHTYRTEEYRCTGVYQNQDKWIAFDNSNSQCYVDEFDTEGEALSWLRGENETSELLKLNPAMSLIGTNTTLSSPSGTHAKIKVGDDLFLIAREALARLTTLEEDEYGSLYDAKEDMDAIVSCSYSEPLKITIHGTYVTTLAEALHSRKEVDYNDGWIVIRFSDNMLYVNYSPAGWANNHPGATPRCHFNDAYRQELIEKGWERTDPSTEQWGRKVDDFTWEYFDNGQGPEAAVKIDVRDYTFRQIENAIQPFGYTMLPVEETNIQVIYGKSYIQIIAECIFEMCN